ncbi:MAG: hypothetical protein LKJ47_01600 [Bifidobacteriaceae bacterium]|jgi:hypothetical protein|nr:hypothetical protein [Bifidobacteriaceae bacterium]
MSLRSTFLTRYPTAQDRTAVYSAASGVSNFVLAIVKIIMGAVLWSVWLIIFGGYYVLLFSTRAFLVHRYVLLSRSEVTEGNVNRFLRLGGILYILLGAVFTLCAVTMYFGGYTEKFTKVTAITIATIGFYKIISAIVGFVRVRKMRHGPLIFLKAVSIADGLVAIVLTQYALLSFEKSAQANTSTGLFGMGVGVLITVVGVVITIIMFRRGGAKD